MKYSIKELGRSYKLSAHFTLGEFACKDNSDTVLVSPELIRMLERLRDYIGGTISINSGYRTAAYNKKIGGASRSQHIYGTAADIVVKKGGKIISAKKICCLCQYLGFAGIGYISTNATHVDMRSSGSYRGDERKGYSGNVNDNFFTYFNISQKEIMDMDARKDIAPVPKKEEEKQEIKPIEAEEEEVIYKSISEVPEWGQKSVQMRIDHGWTDGKNLTETMVRCWTIADREDPYIVNIDDVPTWAKKEVAKLIDAGKLKGTGVEQIGMRFSVLRALIVMNRG